jgi:hypothetical protein
LRNIITLGGPKEALSDPAKDSSKDHGQIDEPVAEDEQLIFWVLVLEGW